MTGDRAPEWMGVRFLLPGDVFQLGPEPGTEGTTEHWEILEGPEPAGQAWALLAVQRGRSPAETVRWTADPDACLLAVRGPGWIVDPRLRRL